MWNGLPASGIRPDPGPVPTPLHPLKASRTPNYPSVRERRILWWNEDLAEEDARIVRYDVSGTYSRSGERASLKAAMNRLLVESAARYYSARCGPRGSSAASGRSRRLFFGRSGLALNTPHSLVTETIRVSRSRNRNVHSQLMLYGCRTPRFSEARVHLVRHRGKPFLADHSIVGPFVSGGNPFVPAQFRK